MDNPAQNPLDPNSTNSTPPPESGLTPPPPTPMLGGLTNTDTIPPSVPPSVPEQPMPSESAPITVDQIYAPSTPNDVPVPPANIPTPPQESYAPEPVQDLSGIENPAAPTPLPNSQTPYQQTPVANYNPAPEYQPVPDYSQQPPNPEFAPQPNTPPPPPAKSPKGFIIGGLIALIIVAAIFAVMMLANKNNDSLPKPSKSKTTPTPLAMPTIAPTEIPLPTMFIPPTPSPTPKTVETFINSTYKYKFDYAMGLPSPKKVEPDPVRFPKSLEVVTLPLSVGQQATTSAYFIVWDKVEDVPQYITDGQSQFVKVNLYTTNRFTIKKPDLTEETHYLTQKFDNTYDIMLQSATGKISDPAFEKILNSFTFIEEVSTAAASPAASAKPSPTVGL